METTVVLTGVGHQLPGEKIENQFFENLGIGSSSDWVAKRTGIKSRYSVLSKKLIESLRYDQTNYAELRKEKLIPTMASLSEDPWKKALLKAGYRSDEGFVPQILISGTSVPDYDIPANASSIAKRLGFSSTCFDVNSACSSFLSDLMTVYGLLKSGLSENAAIFNIERYSTRMNYKDKNSCVLFGDGSSACIVEKGTYKTGLRIRDLLLKSDAKGHDTVIIPYGGVFSQEGAKVQKFAISKTCDITKELLLRNELTASDVSYFIGHQANLRMLQSASRKLGFSDDRHLYNVDRYGNQGASGAPSVLAENFDLFVKGDLIVVTVVGAGLTWGSVLLEKV